MANTPYIKISFKTKKEKDKYIASIDEKRGSSTRSAYIKKILNDNSKTTNKRMANTQDGLLDTLEDILTISRITELETRAAMHLFIAQYKLNLDKNGKKRELFDILQLDGKHGVPKKILDMVTKDTK